MSDTPHEINLAVAAAIGRRVYEYDEKWPDQLPEGGFLYVSRDGYIVHHYADDGEAYTSWSPCDSIEDAFGALYAWMDKHGPAQFRLGNLWGNLMWAAVLGRGRRKVFGEGNEPAEAICHALINAAKETT